MKSGPKLKTLLLSLFLTFAFANADGKKPSAKKAPVKRTPAQNLTYDCRVQYTYAKRSMETNVTLQSEVKFEGLESHEEVTVSIKNGVKSIAINSYFDSPAKPYIVDTLSCDDYLSCHGTRETFANGTSTTKELKIGPSGGMAEARLGVQPIAEFNRETNGFSFRSVDYQSASTNYGLHIKCVAR